MNFTTFLIFISFWKNFFYPRQLPTPTPTTLDPRHLATLVDLYSIVCVTACFSICLTTVCRQSFYLSARLSAFSSFRRFISRSLSAYFISL